MFIFYQKRLNSFLFFSFNPSNFTQTIFLQHALGCLTVKDSSNQDQILSPDELWNKFSAKDPYFPIKYAVYYHYRSIGWIVKCGLKFGCDYSNIKLEVNCL
jgi:tRNA splicing endonuclease